jgi:hypothetical protein
VSSGWKNYGVDEVRAIESSLRSGVVFYARFGVPGMVTEKNRSRRSLFARTAFD